MRTGESGGRVRIDRRGQLAASFLGLAGGMGVNLLSEDLGYRGLAAAFAVGAVLTATNWLRRLPSRAPLPRYTPPVLLTLALAAAVLTLAAPQAWAGPGTLASAGLVAAAVLIPTDLDTASGLLFGAALIGAGVAAIGFGVARLRDGDPLGGAALVGMGVAAVGMGVAVLRAGDPLLGAACIGLGVAAVGFGAAWLRAGGLLFGAACIGFGAACIGFGAARLRGRGVGDVVRGWWARLTGEPTPDHAAESTQGTARDAP